MLSVAPVTSHLVQRLEKVMANGFEEETQQDVDKKIPSPTSILVWEGGGREGYGCQNWSVVIAVNCVVSSSTAVLRAISPPQCTVGEFPSTCLPHHSQCARHTRVATPSAGRPQRRELIAEDLAGENHVCTLKSGGFGRYIGSFSSVSVTSHSLCVTGHIWICPVYACAIDTTAGSDAIIASTHSLTHSLTQWQA
ncbi:hypothetical protein J6590_036135 [Homalodisca vitripennis]|nr:hypothetical protein J6590_036135 [Homalodisca vitripennis]